MSDSLGPTHLGRNTRIMIGNLFAEVFAENATPETTFHWKVQRSDKPGVIVLGEQSTYEIALLEAEHHLVRLAKAENSGHLPLLRRAISA